MSESDLSLHFALLHNLNTGEFNALKRDKADELTLSVLDVKMPEAELGRRLFHCTQWNARGRTQLQSTLGLAQLISDNPIYTEFAQTTLPKYSLLMDELRDDPDAVRQGTELLLEDIKEVVVDSQVLGVEAAREGRALFSQGIRSYWRRGRWDMEWTFYKTLDKVQNAIKMPGTLRYGDPATMAVPAPTIPDFRTVSLPVMPAESKIAAVIPIWFGTNRERNPHPKGEGDKFTKTRDLAIGVGVHYGLARVTIPKRHTEGKIERPKWWKWDFYEDEERHIVLKRVHVVSEELWIARASAAGAEGLVFVHGFNVSFEEAMCRAAQLAYDLKFDGPVFCFSWASCGGAQPLDYTTDEGTILWSEAHLETFLKTITAKLGLKRLHVIAHSMGNRAVLGILTKWAQVPGAAPFSQMVLAAPDADAPTFVTIASHFSKCERLTLYASRADWAIGFSRKLHTYPRLGDANPPVVVPGVDTIDATVAGADVLGLGHGYFAEKPKIFSDLFYVITQRAIPAGKRARLRQHLPPGYYELQ